MSTLNYTKDIELCTPMSVEFTLDEAGNLDSTDTMISYRDLIEEHRGISIGSLTIRSVPASLGSRTSGVPVEALQGVQVGLQEVAATMQASGKHGQRVKSFRGRFQPKPKKWLRRLNGMTRPGPRGWPLPESMRPWAWHALRCLGTPPSSWGV